jgi:hypothetical protein
LEISYWQERVEFEGQNTELIQSMINTRTFIECEFPKPEDVIEEDQAR